LCKHSAPFFFSTIISQTTFYCFHIDIREPLAKISYKKTGGSLGGIMKLIFNSETFKGWFKVLILWKTYKIFNYHSTLAILTLITLEMLKFPPKKIQRTCFCEGKIMKSSRKIFLMKISKLINYSINSIMSHTQLFCSFKKPRTWNWKLRWHQPLHKIYGLITYLIYIIYSYDEI
jgi:hypothetical protein